MNVGVMAWCPVTDFCAVETIRDHRTRLLVLHSYVILRGNRAKPRCLYWFPHSGLSFVLFLVTLMTSIGSPGPLPGN